MSVDNSLMQRIQDEQAARTTRPATTPPTAGPPAAPAQPQTSKSPTLEPSVSLPTTAQRQTRQLGYRVGVDTLDEFRAFRDRLNAAARKKGLREISYGELAELALKRLVQEDPKHLLV